jgi:RNA-splicing ligase RtcB
VDGDTTEGKPVQRVTDRLFNWASDIEAGTIDQALKTSRLEIVTGHVALMPDAHIGLGATVGSVIPTDHAIIPAAVGVDIGCGMIAVETDLAAPDLPDNLDRFQPRVREVGYIGHGREVSRINCHHNYTAREVHAGRETWITRKGAIRAGAGELGIIPGSMGTSSYIVSGLGHSLSYESYSHWAGRRMSRGHARRTLSAASLTEAMGSRSWQDRSAEDLVDEHPAAYKDIDRVMADQADLVEVVHTLRQVLNYKGTDGGRRRRGKASPPPDTTAFGSTRQG